MPTAIRMIGHEDRLSLVAHLEELRTRLIISVATLVVAFGLCFWQNHHLLHIINAPLSRQTIKQVKRGEGPLGQTALAQQGVLRLSRETQAVLGVLAAPGSGLSARTRARLKPYIPRLEKDLAAIPRVPEGNKPLTTGLSEPFTQTLTVALFCALIISLPVILYELYGFLLPAFSPRERRVANSLVTAIPFLFIVGVLFGYFVVLPAAVHFFQNFNSSEFNVLVQAGQYYKVAGTILLAMGLVFQVPVAILGASRLEIVTPRQLRKGRPYAMIVCAAVAAFLPGDVITLMLETVPLYLLYELSILLASLFAWRDNRRARAQTPSPGSGSPPAGPGGPPGGSPGGGPRPAGQPPPASAPSGPTGQDEEIDPEVRQAIDHFDRTLSR